MIIIEIVLTIIFGIFIGILFAHFYFRAKVELAARRIGDEIKARFERDGSRPMKHGKVRPHKTRKSLEIPQDLSGGWSEYLDSRARCILERLLSRKIAPQ